MFFKWGIIKTSESDLLGSFMVQRKTSFEQVRIWRLPFLRGIEMLRATCVTQSFPRHFHENFPVGVIERGALRFYYRGANVVAPAGSINLANPGETHTGQAASATGWTYRMFYFEPSLVQEVAAQIGGKARMPFFPAGVIEDNNLAGLIRQQHLALEEPGVPALEQEARILGMLTQLILRHADDRPIPRPVGREHRAVKLAQGYIEENYAENITLKHLSLMVDLSSFHLTRVFSREVGMPLHSYLNQVRVRRAKEMIGRGSTVTEAALGAGFYDQSHLTRNFKRLLGVTPGQYRKSVQDGSVLRRVE